MAFFRTKTLGLNWQSKAQLAVFNSLFSLVWFSSVPFSLSEAILITLYPTHFDAVKGQAATVVLLA